MRQETQWVYALSAVRLVCDCAIEPFAPFIEHTDEDALREEKLTVRLCRAPAPFDGTGLTVAVQHPTLTVRRGKGFWSFTAPRAESLCEFRVTSDYTGIGYYRDPACEDFYFLRLLQVALECASLCRGVLSMHSACVELNGEAVSFTAPSGTGKSTRAAAWVSAFGAALISGDRPQLLLREDGLFLCGVPWDGKEKVFRNGCFPVRAIFEVRRSDRVGIRRLSPKQKLNVLSAQCFIPMWDSLLAARALALMRHIARSAPMYRLFCGPDEDGAQAVHSILYDHPDQIKEEAPDMQLKKGFILHEVVGEYVVMPAGDRIGTYNGTVILNEVSAFIWNQLLEPVAYDDLLDRILEEYAVDRDTAKTDLDALLVKFREYDLLED